jgi:RES domain-containing protein
MSLTAWRIVKTIYVGTAFGGEGAFRFGGRWNSKGTRVVYVSKYASLAVLEMLVHLDSTAPLPNYSIIEIKFDQALVEILDPNTLPANWHEIPVPSATEIIGDTWVTQNRSAILEVPSAVLSIERNFVINPEHPDFPQIEIGIARPFLFDNRLL